MSMTPAEIATYATKLKTELDNMDEITMGNYKDQLKEYRRILGDIIILIRNNAQNSIPNNKGATKK